MADQLDAGLPPDEELPPNDVIFDSSAEEEDSPLPPPPPSVDGVFPSEVRARLSHNLYEQLSDGSEEFVLEALRRAKVELDSVLGWLGVPVDSAVPVQREALLYLAVYHLHLALGHEDEGSEFRRMAQLLVSNHYGSYPASGEEPASGGIAAGVVVAPPASPRSAQLHRARRW